MKLSIATSLLFSASALAKGISFLGGDSQAPLADDVQVPGNNPLQFCDADRSKDLITIEKVDLTPNPPAAGQALSIVANGTFLEDIAEGAYVELSVKYGCCITLIKTTQDICDQVSQVNLECPLKKGSASASKDVNIPSAVPPGKYTVLAKLFTVDDRPITCLTAQVQFG